MSNELKLNAVSKLVHGQSGPWNKDTPKKNPYATWIDWCPKCGGDLYVKALTMIGNNERVSNVKVPFHKDGFDFSDYMPDDCADWDDLSTEDEEVSCERCGKVYQTADLHIEDHPRKFEGQMHNPPPPQPPAIVQQHQPQQWEIVAACLIAEAGGESNPSQAMTAVMDVVVNRSGRDPSKFAGVVMANKQFSCTAKGAVPMVAKASRHAQWPVAVRIVQMACAGNLPDITGGAKFYMNPKLASPSWAKGKKPSVVIGNHNFYANIK